MKATPTGLARGYSIAVLSAFVLSNTAILVRMLSNQYHMPALALSFWRALFSAAVVGLVFVLLGSRLFRVTRTQLAYLSGYGLVMAVFNSLWTTSVVLNGAAVSNVLVYCSTAFTVLLGWWLLKERLTLLKALAVLFCLLGSALVSQAVDPQVWGSNGAGILVGVLSGLLYAAYSLMGRSAAKRGLNPWTTLFYTFGFAAFFLLAFNFLPGPLPGAAATFERLLWLKDSWAGWGLLLLLAAGPTVLGYGLYNVSLTYLPSSTANLVVTLEPVLTVITAYFLLGERLDGLQIAGGVLILGAVAALRIFGREAAA
jgi:drug/metabolite transporter (DMT)-like permease